jgi:hypothetical protein
MKYPALRVISFLIRMLGWLLILLGLLALLTWILEQTGHLPLAADDPTYEPIFSYGGITALILGLCLLAFGELIKVFIDIALNTSHLIPKDKE